MRIRGAAILAVLSAFAPACGGSGSGGSPVPLVFTPLPLVDTSAPNHTINTGQADNLITNDLQTALNSGGIIVFNNVGAKAITLSAELILPADKTAVIDGKDTITLSGGTTRRILNKSFNSVLTVQRLNFVDARATDSGAAILASDWNGYVTVIQCHFSNCKTTAAGPDKGGGAIRPIGQRHVQVSESTFTDCDGSNGGAIDSIGSQITLINCDFTDCDAFGTGGGASNGGIGGAVYIDGVSQNADQRRLDIVGCRFITNSAQDHGGALFAYTIAGTGSIVNIDQSTFEGNSIVDTTPAVGFGGAIYQQNNSFTVTRTTFETNTAQTMGGAIWSSCNSGTIENCTFHGNQAVGSPGFGGALNISGTFLINACTIAQNHGAGWGGGIFAGSPSTTTLRNSLLMNNTGVDLGNGWNVSAPLGHGSNNLQWPTTRGGGGPADTPALPSVLWADAMLQPPADNGPHPPTNPPKTMAILAGSPAIDAGHPNTAPDTDQRGMGRVGAPDAGAFEKQ